MMSVAKAADTAVAAKIAFGSIPAAERILGFTASMYVSHCKECCNAGNNLGFDISAVFFQFENFFQKKAPLKYFVETRHS